MPVKVVKRGEKYRIVDPNGKLTKRKKSAVDGGGHKNRNAALKQAAAINSSLRSRGKI